MNELPRRLGLWDAVVIVSGTVIGSGIFLVPNLVARQLPSPAVILGAWIFAGLLSLAGALAFAELGAMFPRTGGAYVFLREEFGQMAGFLFGWTFFLVVAGASIAWLATTFTIYLTHFFPLPPWGRQGIALLLLAILTAVNARGVQLSAGVQRLFTTLKLGGLAVIVAAAFLNPVNHLADSAGGAWTYTQFGAALMACLITYDGWIVLSNVAGEVKQPHRNLPLGLAMGVGICMLAYLLANIAYLKVLTVSEIAATERVAARVAGATIGSAGGGILSAIVLLSITGAVNGWLLTAPRVYYAQAHDQLFFRRFGDLHPRFLTPRFSIVAQGVWSGLLCLTGTYETLGAFAMFAVWLFYGVTVLGVIVLRRRLPNAGRPYRMWGYPLLPVVFSLTAFGFVGNTFLSDPKPAWTGTAIILAGIPAYHLWRKIK